jgi:hypothetical protein
MSTFEVEEKYLASAILLSDSEIHFLREFPKR